MQYKRGDKVDYNPEDRNGTPCKGTYVWAIMEHLMIRYVIEHPNGHPKSRFTASGNFPDGFESIHSSQLDDNLLYMYAKEEELSVSK